MKKKILLITLLTTLILCIGCSNDSKNTNKQPKETTKKSENKTVKETNEPIDAKQILSDAYNFSVENIWNNGLCDISHYVEDGTNSAGEKMNPKETLDKLENNMSKFNEYNDKISKITDKEFEKQVKQWNIVYNEASKLYNGISLKDNKMSLKYDDFDKFTNAQDELCNLVYEDLFQE